jgi:hypothetical protein
MESSKIIFVSDGDVARSVSAETRPEDLMQLRGRAMDKLVDGVD